MSARRYMLALRTFYVGLLLFPLPIVIALVVPGGAVLFFGMVACFLIDAVAVAGTAMYLSDFECPQCHLVSTCRRSGNGFPRSRCLNCGLSLKAATFSHS